MATSHYKLNRKALKQPDEFVTLLDWAGDFFIAHMTQIILAVVAVIVLAAVWLIYSIHVQQQQRITSDRFFVALTALNQKDYKTAEQGFTALADDGSGRLAGLARFYVASAYMAENNFAKARDALEAYLKTSSHPLFEGLALNQLGVADENLNDFSQAHDAYARAAQLNSPAQADAQLGVARTLLKQGDKAGAIAAYQRFLADNPFSMQRGDAVEALAALGVTIAGPAPAGAQPVVNRAPGSAAAVAGTAATPAPAKP